MGKLIIEGDDKQLQAIATRARLAVSKYGLKLTLTGNDKTAAKTSEGSKEASKEETSKEAAEEKVTINPEELTAPELIAVIETMDSLDELKALADDERVTVQRAVSKRIKELKN